MPVMRFKYVDSQGNNCRIVQLSAFQAAGLCKHHQAVLTCKIFFFCNLYMYNYDFFSDVTHTTKVDECFRLFAQIVVYQILCYRR